MIQTKNLKPKSCGWEVTLACNANCIHCGSEAGKKRSGELDTEEGLSLLDQLAELGCKSLTLLGGEPLLRKDLFKLVSHGAKRGINVDLITNGLLVAEKAAEIAGAGFYSVSFSVDGPRDDHDRLRGMRGAFDALEKGVEALKKKNMRLGAVTQVNKLNMDKLNELRIILESMGFEGWQIQLTMPSGRAKKSSDSLIMEPEQMLLLEKVLVELREKTEMFFQIGDNIGYMSRFEPILRAGTRRADRFFAGCSAGLRNLGIMSDGTVRGCASLPSKFDEGNVRKRSLKDIWFDPEAFPYNRKFEVKQLEGHCGKCPLAEFCRGGCKSTAHAVLGSILEQPYCLLAMQQKWVRNQ